METSRASRGVATMVCIALVTVCVLWMAGRYRAYKVMESLGMRRSSWYCFAAPGFSRYASVAVGSSSDAIIQRLGMPAFECGADNQQIRRYINVRDRAGWSSPPSVSHGRIMVYEAVDGDEMVVVYYFISDGDRLLRIFVSET